MAEEDINRWLWEWGEQIEAMAEDFPLLKDICKGLKRNQYPAALFVAGGLMMTLMTRCTYRFYHRPEELRRLNNSTLIIGDPASGKSFATRLFKLLASPIVEADKIGKDAINAYREQMRTKGANKEKPKKPKVVVRIHPARTSNAQFIQDMVNAVEEVNGEPMQLHMLTFDTELDNTLSLQKGGSYIDKQALQLKAFHNEEDGQAYSNVDSVFQEFYVIWNYIYTGTPIALKRMVNEQNFGSGLATRLTCIPLPATNFEMMSRESFVDYDSDNRLKEWAEKLDKVKGELSVQKIVDELYDWTARRMEDAKENDSKADEMLLKRCAYHGLNFSAPFIVMRHWDKMKQDGQYWCGEFDTDEVDWKLAELIVNIQYACQRHYFGAMAENYFDNKLKDASVNIQRKQRTLEAFNRLPDEFTIEDVVHCFNLGSAASARKKVTRLCRDHLIEKVSEDKGGEKAVFHKTGSIMEIVQLNSKMKLSEHFTHGEMTKSNSHPEIYNIPSHEAIANMKRLCGWLEVLRSRAGAPIIINSGYRSPQLNKKIGGAANSNHLTGCAVDIRTSEMEQAICYAAILINYAKESQHDFDELLIEKNRYGAVWVHFAVRPSNNRRKVMFLNA